MKAPSITLDKRGLCLIRYIIIPWMYGDPFVYHHSALLSLPRILL